MDNAILDNAAILDKALLDAPSATSGDAGLAVRRIASTTELAAVAQDWNRLANDVPFRRWEWLDAWWQNYSGDRDDLFVLAVYDTHERLVGLAPWYRHHSRWFGRVIRFLGSGIVCSDYLTVLVEPSQQDAVCQAIVAWLEHDGNGQWDALELEAVDQSDSVINALVERFAADQHTNHTRPALNCWQLPLTADWESYVKSLSSSRRSQVRRLVRKFDSGEFQLHWAQDRQSLDRGWEILVDLHQRRRKMLGQPGCFSTPQFTRFLRLAAERFLELGRLRLQWVEAEGRPIAIEIDLAGSDTVYMYQSGIEPNALGLNPGWLGTIAATRRATQDGFRTFDFLRGDEPYKGSWRAQPIPLVDRRIVAQGCAAQCRHALWLTVQQAKGIAKAMLQHDARGGAAEPTLPTSAQPGNRAEQPGVAADTAAKQQQKPRSGERKNPDDQQLQKSGRS